MRLRSKGPAALVLAAGVAAVAGARSPEAAQEKAPAPTRGAELYARWCAGCHGDEGRGDGPAAERMLPRPRDFTRALYQVRTTPSGSLPADDDLLRVILSGMPGTTMPGWKKKFSAQELRELVRHLKAFSPFFESEPPPERVAVGRPPKVTEEGLREGRALYEKIECWKCHGQAGRGDGPSAPTLRDDAELPIRAMDLTENWNFNGGGSVEEIFARLKTGLDGTPMPSFTDLIDAEVITEEGLWRMAQYVRSLSPGKPPVVREVVRAERIEGELPASPDDSIWDSVERFYFPLVGQVIVKPRWFAPTVDGVWVQALHNGRQLALRLVWHDPSRSPSAEWMEWQQAVLMTMAQDSGALPAAEPLPDAFAVQFPRRIPEGPQRPYFLMGTATEPVYLWRWQSGPGGA
ncbi:MAG: c-type cytochrome, partial [Gemmatimonadetes bacterium]|nr:c-type cytochrome [Gemmatimonadota bacterium]